MKTAYRYWDRTRKIQYFAETGVQAGARDLDRKVQQDLKMYQKETEKQQKEIAQLTVLVEKEKAYSERQDKKVSQL